MRQTHTWTAIGQLGSIVPIERAAARILLGEIMKASLCLALSALLLIPLAGQAPLSAQPQASPWPIWPYESVKAAQDAEVAAALEQAKRGNFEPARAVFQRLAEQDHADAQYHLGIMYYYGESLDVDYKTAFGWWSKAAKSGHAGAQVDLGIMYFKGRGIKANKKEAARLFQAAAEQGNAAGQRNLALSYLDGEGLPKNTELGLKWLKAAAAQGDERSLHYLAQRYDKGDGVKRDPKEAFRLYAKAAVNGDLEAQLELAQRYFDGRGTERDIVKARTWARILGGNGDVGSLITFNGGEISVGASSTSIRVPALQLAKKAEEAMSPAQIEQSDALRKACLEEEDAERAISACGLQ